MRCYKCDCNTTGLSLSSNTHGLNKQWYREPDRPWLDICSDCVSPNDSETEGLEAGEIINLEGGFDD